MGFRLLRMGLNTLLGLKKQGFFIPYRYADTLPIAEKRDVYPALLAHMKKLDPRFQEFLNLIASYKNNFSTFGSKPPPYPRWEQDWFPRLDGAAAYTMVRMEKPNQIIEVGSGHSTRFMMQAVLDENLPTKMTAIDPAPRADISKLPIQIHNDIVQNVDPDLFTKLQAGDILFIDSSHIAMPGTDVDYLFLNILPTLPKGVIVHIHDIFLPHAYPASWEWRGYNEQQIVAPLIFGDFEILFSSAYAARYLTTHLSDTQLDRLPLSDGAFETSLWLRKQS